MRAKRDEFVALQFERRNTKPGDPRVEEIEEELKSLRTGMQQLGDCGCRKRRAMRAALDKSISGPATIREATEEAS